jgi:uncharacterized protein (TIGR02271 family)
VATMVPHAQIEPGASVEATDGRFGTVQSVIAKPGSGDVSYLLVRHGDGLVSLPVELIAEVVSPVEVRVGATRDDVRSRLGGTSSAVDEREQIRVPLYEERLRTSIRPVDLGEVRVHKTVERVPTTTTRSVERDEVEIERVRLDRLLDQPVEPYRDGEWLVVPVMEGVLVITKQLVLTEEVRIRTKRVAEEQEVYEILRREHVSIEDATVHGALGPIDAQPVTQQDGPPSNANEA